MQPSNLKAEAEVLSTIFINNNALMDIIDKLKPEDFYSSANQLIYGAMIELFKKDIGIDPITIANLIGDSKLRVIGGLTYLSELMGGGLRTTNIRHYADIVLDKSKRRKLMTAANSIVANIEEDMDKLVGNMEDCLMNISTDEQSNKVLTDSELMMNTLTYIEDNYKKGGSITGMQTGYKKLDKAINGFVKKDLVVIAGRPSMGKTCFALNVASRLGSENKVLIFELEMSAEKLGARRLAAATMVNATDLPRGNIKDADWERIAAKAGAIASKNNIFTDTTPGISMAEIKSKAKKIKIKYGLDVIIIDHLGLLSPSNSNAPRVQQVSELTKQAKIMAKELNVTVILLSQLNRECEARKNKRPLLSDLRESGTIEQDADLVMGVYRDAYYNPKSEDKNTIEIIVLKQRDGALGTVKMAYIPEYQLISDLDCRS